MENKSNYSHTRVTNLFLFNSTWGPKEREEEKKIVYFWPEEVSLQDKLKRIGLVEGVVIFSNKFSSLPAHSLHTLKERTVFLEVEKDFWLCLTVSVPSSRKSGKDSGEIIEFYPEDVNDEVLLSLIQQSYDMFCLFHSSLQSALNRCEGKRTVLIDLVQHFYSRYMATLRPQKADVTSVWGGVQYLALDSTDFLRVQSLVHRMKSEFQDIRRCLCLQSGQLVWSGVDPPRTKLLVQYLSTTILPLLPNLSRQPCGSFLVGEEEPLPVIYIDDSVYHLAVFHAINTTLCLLLDKVPNKTFFTDFKESVGKETGNLSADLTHVYFSKQTLTPANESISFLYFNAANLAVKSTVDEGQEKSVKIAADFIEDLKKCGNHGGEIMAKLWSEEWVVVQVAGSRTIVILLQEKSLNLMEVAEAVARIEKTSFDSICML